MVLLGDRKAPGNPGQGHWRIQRLPGCGVGIGKYIPFADFKKQLSIGASAELPDLVIIDSPDHASYAAMGIFADISDKVSDWDEDRPVL